MMTRTTFEVPTQPQAQKLTITLASVEYNLQLVWNASSLCWVLDILDALLNQIATGIPLVTGADLIGQLAYLGIGGGLVVASDGVVDAVPQYADLGSIGHLYFAAA